MTEKEKRTLKDGVKNLIGKYKALEHGIIEVLENNIFSFIDSIQEEPVSTKDKLLALSDGRLHLGWIDDAKVVEFEECLMQFHEDMNNIPQGTDSLTRLKDTDGVLHSYSKKLMSMAKEEPVSEDLEKEYDKYIENDGDESLSKEYFLKLCQHFANWQKEQFEKDYTNLCNGIATAKGLSVAMAYDKGMADAKEQMMAKSTETTFNVSLPSGLYDKLWAKDCKEGDKLLVIKKDEL